MLLQQRNGAYAILQSGISQPPYSRHHAKRRTRINLVPSVSGRVFVEMRRMRVRMRIRRRITQIRILRRAVVLRTICPIKAST